MNKLRIITVALAALVVVLTGVVVMFAFGAPQRPVGLPQEAASNAAPPAAPAGALPDDGPQDSSPQTDTIAEETAASGTGDVPAPDPESPFAIEIPGCVCHSDDPALVRQHSEYRMNQCFGCHAGGMPEMGG